MNLNSEDQDDNPKPERLPIYRKRREIFDMVNKIGPYDKDPDDDIPFHGFEEDPE